MIYSVLSLLFCFVCLSGFACVAVIVYFWVCFGLLVVVFFCLGVGEEWCMLKRRSIHE